MPGKPNTRGENFGPGARRTNGAGRRLNFDARSKLNTKFKAKPADARDRLAQLAKKTDARQRILRLQQNRGGENQTRMSVRPIGKNLIKKVDGNGKVSISTRGFRPEPQIVKNDIVTQIRRELGLNQQKPTVSHTQNRATSPAKYFLPPTPPSTLTNNSALTTYSPPMIQRTIRNEMGMPALIPVMSKPPSHLAPNLYSWVRNPPRRSPRQHELARHELPRHELPRHELQPRQELASLPRYLTALHQNVREDETTIEVTARNDQIDDSPEKDWGYADPELRSIKLASMVIDDDMDEEDDEMLPMTTRRTKTGVHARLDTPAVVQKSQGIFANPRPRNTMPVGHRIVVSNLQTSVTKDDIRELFEDIGELMVSRLVRPGTAEVIYKNLKDAQKAVDTYHNRQLDGQPMKCLLCHTRPLNNPTAPAIRPQRNSNLLRSSGGVTKKTTNSTKLVPDIGTIHKVLFHKT